MKNSAIIILGAGIVAALHVGKLPTALPLLKSEFGLSLVQASTLIAVLQLSTACIGLFGGALADRFGHVRSMVGGLLLMALGSALGAFARDPFLLLLTRGLESLGFIFTVLPGPTLLRQRIAPERLPGWLGWWGAYMPFGMGTGLLIVPLMPGWRSAWGVIAAISLVWAFLVFQVVGRGAVAGLAHAPTAMLHNARRTLASAGPWWLSLCFCFYAAQFMGLFGFLPTIYKEAGVSAAMGGVLTAVGVLFNALGNIQGGKLAQRGVPVHRTIIASAIAMALTAWLVFADPLAGLLEAFMEGPAAQQLAFWLRYLAVVGFSWMAGRIPASLFTLSNRFAPGPEVVATTVGFMQQGAAIGQLFAPVSIAWLATATGAWTATWWLMGAWTVVVIIAAYWLARHQRGNSAAL